MLFFFMFMEFSDHKPAIGGGTIYRQFCCHERRMHLQFPGASLFVIVRFFKKFF